MIADVCAGINEYALWERDSGYQAENIKLVEVLRLVYVVEYILALHARHGNVDVVMGEVNCFQSRYTDGVIHACVHSVAVWKMRALWPL